MLAFITLLLGLTVGVQPVQLTVGSAVHRVELRLDGQTVASLRHAPWTAPVDFGDRLLPHHLEAVAFDADGHELDHVAQWVNLPRQPAECSLVVSTGRDGQGAIAHLTWHSILGTDPKSIRLSFDDRQIPVDDPAAIPLPDYDPEALHFLRAELDFPDNLSSVVELTLGGRWLARTSSELTAIPVQLERKHDVPDVSQLQTQLRIASQPAKVSALEEGPAQILLVLDEEARREFNNIVEQAELQTRQRRARFGFRALQQFPRSTDPLLTVLRPTDWIRFIWPQAQPVRRGDAAYDVFDYSREFTTEDGSFTSLLTSVRPPASLHGNQRLSDAVAVAGLLATARSRRRVVILVTDSEPSDASELEPAQVVGFLRALHVPFYVWIPEEEIAKVAGVWGQAESISTLRKFEKAVKKVAGELERQRIVWVEGEFLPQQVSLSPQASAVALAE